MHRETFIEKLTEVQRTVEEMLAELQASEHDKFAAFVFIWGHHASDFGQIEFAYRGIPEPGIS